MKKKIFGGIAIVAIAVAVALNVNMTSKKSDNASLLALANVEALADDGETSAGGCDPTKYVINAVEDWHQQTFEGKAGADGYITVEGYKFGPFGAGASVSFTYQKGICPTRNQNCCDKSHIGKVTVL